MARELPELTLGFLSWSAKYLASYLTEKTGSTNPHVQVYQPVGTDSQILCLLTCYYWWTIHACTSSKYFLLSISFLPFLRTALKPISLLSPKASLSLLSWIISISILTSCYSPILNTHTASLVPISPFSCFQKAQPVTMPKIKFLVFTAKTDLLLSSSPQLTVTASSLWSFSD